jgi:hypothetical protein
MGTIVMRRHVILRWEELSRLLHHSKLWGRDMAFLPAHDHF